MSHQNDTEGLQRQLRKYKLVFISLIVFTFVTVGFSYVHIESTAVSVAVALLVAGVEALLVGGIMMHLFAERKIIYLVLALTFVFFAVMMYLILWSNQPNSRLHWHY